MTYKKFSIMNDVIIFRYLHALDQRKRALRCDMALQFAFLFATQPDFLLRTWWSDESNGTYIAIQVFFLIFNI